MVPENWIRPCPQPWLAQQSYRHLLWKELHQYLSPARLALLPGSGAGAHTEQQSLQPGAGLLPQAGWAFRSTHLFLYCQTETFWQSVDSEKQSNPINKCFDFALPGGKSRGESIQFKWSHWNSSVSVSDPTSFTSVIYYLVWSWAQASRLRLSHPLWDSAHRAGGRRGLNMLIEGRGIRQ